MVLKFTVRPPSVAFCFLSSDFGGTEAGREPEVLAITRVAGLAIE